MQGHMFAPPDPHAELQPIQPIEAADPLAIHPPALASQQHPDAHVAKPRPGLGEIPNAHS
jgi:hypothetical protein